MSKVRWENRRGRQRLGKTPAPQRATGVIRIDTEAYAALHEFAELTGIPVRVLVSRAVALLRDNERFSRLVHAKKKLEEAEAAFVKHVTPSDPALPETVETPAARLVGKSRGRRA